MNRVWTGLLILLTAVVLGGVVYVLGHNTSVPDAGQTPGYSTPAQTTPVSTPAPTTSAVAATSSVASSSSASGSSTSASSDGSTVMAFLGDDYTHGLGSSSTSKTFTSLVTSALHVKGTRFYVDNAGYAKSGSNGKTYADLVQSVIDAHPDIVVVSGGRNDRADDPNTLTSKAASVFAALRAGLPHAKIVAVAPWWGDSAHPSDLDSVDSAVKAGVLAVGGTYLDIDDPLFGHPSWMADAADPNDQGYAAIAASLEPRLQQLLG